MLGDWQCAKAQLQKRAAQWSKRHWDQFSQLFLKYRAMRPMQLGAAYTAPTKFGFTGAA